MSSYSSIRFTRSLRVGVVKNQLPEIRALPALVKVEADLVERRVDLQFERHRLLGLVADAVVGAMLEAIEGIELVDHLDALLVDPDAEGVADVVTHTRVHTAPGGKPGDMEATA